MASLTKAELARALGVAERDLIERQEAADICGLRSSTLRSAHKDHVGFWKLSDAQNADALYRRDWVEQYRDWRKGGKKGSFHHLGEQDRPSVDQLPVMASDEIMRRVRGWCYMELSRRAAYWLIDEPSANDLANTAQTEANDRMIAGKPVTKELLQEDGVTEMVAALMADAGVKVAEPMLFTAMAMLGAWANVVDTVEAWRRGDFRAFPPALRAR